MLILPDELLQFALALTVEPNAALSGVKVPAGLRVELIVADNGSPPEERS